MDIQSLSWANQHWRFAWGAAAERFVIPSARICDSLLFLGLRTCVGDRIASTAKPACRGACSPKDLRRRGHAWPRQVFVKMSGVIFVGLENLLPHHDRRHPPLQASPALICVASSIVSLVLLPFSPRALPSAHNRSFTGATRLGCGPCTTPGLVLTFRPVLEPQWLASREAMLL